MQATPEQGWNLFGSKITNLGAKWSVHAQPQLQHRRRHPNAFSGLHSASQVSQSAMKCVNRLEQVHLASPIKENAREGFCKLATCELFDELCFHDILWENTWQCRKPSATGRREVRVCSHLALSRDLVSLSSFLSSMELCQVPKGTQQPYWPRLTSHRGSPNLPQWPFWGLAWDRSIASNLPGSLGSASAPWHPLRGRSF